MHTLSLRFLSSHASVPLKLLYILSYFLCSILPYNHTFIDPTCADRPENQRTVSYWASLSVTSLLACVDKYFRRAGRLHSWGRSMPAVSRLHQGKNKKLSTQNLNGYFNYWPRVCLWIIQQLLCYWNNLCIRNSILSVDCQLNDFMMAALMSFFHACLCSVDKWWYSCCPTPVTHSQHSQHCQQMTPAH